MSDTTAKCLAQYDFRTKQKYIFRTNKLREIVGASALITCMYDLFIRELRSNGIRIEKNYAFPACGDTGGWVYQVDSFLDLKYTNDVGTAFTTDFSGDVDGRVLYVGGGNLYILWKDHDTAKKAGGILSALLRREGYSLFPACGLTAFTGDYAKDIRAMSAAFNSSKEIPPFEPMAVLPFTRVDRGTGLPAARKVHEYGKDEYLPEESFLKREVNDRRIRIMKTFDPFAVRELDDLVDKGTDSLLAVIHIDGNNMGERVSAVMQGVSDYPEAVRKIREFSNSIQECFVTRPLAEVSDMLRAGGKQARIIVAGGDDVTLVCRARDALSILKTYFKSLKGSVSAFGKNTACAGMCFFHSHSPFADAYEIAEACCDNAKKVNRLHGGSHMLMDFQYCFSGTTGDLDGLRSIDGHLMGRPYSFEDDAGGLMTVSRLEDTVGELKKIGDDSNSHRGFIKHLSSLLLTGRDTEYDLELLRIRASYAGFDWPDKNAPDYADRKKLLFDIAQVYDLWFDKE